MTDYLLVGNAPTASLAAAASQADVIVQINGCPHADTLPPARTRYIFLTNSGPHTSQLVDLLSSCRDRFPHARVMLARNPSFYTIKKWIMRARSHRHWRDYEVSQAWTRLRGLWPIQTVSCFSAFRLERKLRAMGMPPSCMPSTGMVAYDWLCRRLRPGDSVTVEGFTFQGWERHPWQIERQLVQPKRVHFSWQDGLT